MRPIALLVLVLLAACAPLPGAELEADADAGPGPGFNSCNPGSPDPTGQCGGGGGGTSPTCGHACNSNVECGGAAQRCAFCNFSECRESPPGLIDCWLACGVEPRPTWCDLGGCGEVLRASAP